MTVEGSSKKQKKKSVRSNEESTYRRGSQDETIDDLGRLTNKKREYLEEVIFDKNGEYLYEEDPQEYKKARK